MDLRMPADTYTSSVERTADLARKTAAPPRVSVDVWVVNRVAA